MKYVRYETSIFPGGEVHIKLLEDADTIFARIQSSDDIMRLILLKSVSKATRLILPYIPYARQDRICHEGEAFSLEVFSNLVNNLGFDSVTVVDPHSKVCNLINNIKIIPAVSFAPRIDAIVVAPDEGARVKSKAIADKYGLKLIQAYKRRERNTVTTILECDNLHGKPVVIYDDICDGGRTFTELAKVLKAKGAGDITLFVTHGIFSKGYSLEGISKVISTDSLGTMPIEQIKLGEYYGS